MKGGAETTTDNYALPPQPMGFFFTWTADVAASFHQNELGQSRMLVDRFFRVTLSELVQLQYTQPESPRISQRHCRWSYSVIINVSTGR